MGLRIVTEQEFIIVVRDRPGGLFRYAVYLVPTGADQRSTDRSYITGTDSLRGAKKAIRKERQRLDLGAEVVHRESR